MRYEIDEELKGSLDANCSSRHNRPSSRCDYKLSPPTLMAGSGVNGAIHNAAGPELEKSTKLLGPLKPGQALTTEAFNLPAKYVIHAVAPRYLRGIDKEEQTLASTYQAIVKEFIQLKDVQSI